MHLTIVSGGQTGVGRGALDATPGVRRFVEAHLVRRLNVTGPRASHRPDGRAHASSLLRALFEGRPLP